MATFFYLRGAFIQKGNIARAMEDSKLDAPIVPRPYLVNIVSCNRGKLLILFYSCKRSMHENSTRKDTHEISETVEQNMFP